MIETDHSMIETRRLKNVVIFIYIIKVLSCRLLQCLGSVNTLAAEGCSETGRAIHSTNLVFQT